MTRQFSTAPAGAGKTDTRVQFGAIIWRKRGEKLQVLLVTTRKSGRWMVPKGWPMQEKSPVKAAKIEAWEEAGVHGKAKNRCIGSFTYRKKISPTETIPCMVMLYPLKARKLVASYPESHERRRKWFSPQKAAEKVSNPELAAVLRGLDFNTLR